MAIIKDSSYAIRSLIILAFVAAFLFGGINAFAAGGGEAVAERRAKTSEAEQLLANLGYWITNIDGVSDDSTRQAVIAFQKVEGLKRTGVLNDQVLDELRNASRPVAKYDGAAHVEIDISRQVIFLVDENGQVTKVLSTSTGSGERYLSEGKWDRAYTPRGRFVISRQIHGIRKAPLGTIYNPSYFNGGIAIHGSNSVPVTAASHGCARIPRFADKEFVEMVRVGMPVYVYD
jgi:Putative peptidoglycan binding domain/L,D-transpeptidase catalytic domain